MSSSVLADVTTDNREAVREIAETRRSIRQYVQEPIPAEDLREILRLTGLAPSASNVQTWRFAVVQSPEARAGLIDAMNDNNKRTVESAPASIVLYSDGQDFLDTVEETLHPGMGSEEIAKRAAGMRKRIGSFTPEKLGDWARVQTFIALGQLVLIARGFGYDTSIMGGFQEGAVRELLGLPEHARVTAVVSIGRRAEDGFSHHRHAVERVTRWY